MLKMTLVILIRMLSTCMEIFFSSFYNNCSHSKHNFYIKMPKGKIKRRRVGGQFLPGNKMSPARCLADTSLDTSDDADHAADATPKKPTLRSGRDLQREEQHNYDAHGNRIINMNKLISIMNDVYREHSLLDCEHLNIVLNSELKVGLGSKLEFRCSSCGFLSSKMDSYNRCQSSKAVAVNMLFASALQDTAIGLEKGNLLLASMDIPPPSRSHMQTLMNQASVNTIKINEDDMAVKRQLVIKHNQEQGRKNPNHLDLSFDGRYNANRMISSYKPGQAASQAYGVAIENNTSYNYIVALAVQNKLCWTGAYLRNKGFDITCPGGHAACTANIPYMAPHSERSMAFSIAEQLSKEDILVRSLTTDGDTKAHLGMSDFYDKLGNAWTVNRQADPYHLGSKQVRKTRQSNWSLTMFSGKKLSHEARQQATTALAKDIKSRCHAIIEKLRAEADGDLSKLLNCLPAIKAATLECYGGNCSFCPHDSLVCSGVGGVGSWWYTSTYLPTHGIHHLKMTRNDRELLSTILEIRLSEYAVLSVSSNTSTQKCEGFNRAVLSTLPKEINLSRNFAGNLASKTLQLNNSLQESVTKKVSSITGKPLSPRARRYLNYTSNRAQRYKKYQKTNKFKLQRRSNRAKLEFIYHQARSKGQYKEEYVKGQVDEAGPSN